MQILDTVQTGLIFHLVDLGLGATLDDVETSQLELLGKVRGLMLAIRAGFRLRGLGVQSNMQPQPLREAGLTILQEGFASQLLYIYVLLVSKLSVLFLYLRLSPGGPHRIVSWTLIAASGLWALLATILIAVPCNPIQAFHDPQHCTNRVSPTPTPHPHILTHPSSGRNGKPSAPSTSSPKSSSSSSPSS